MGFFLLREVKLSRCHIKNLDLGIFTRHKIDQLNLSDCLISDEGLGYLAPIFSLKVLDLSRCSEITDEGLKHLTRLPLERLYLSGCSKLTNKGLEYLPPSLIKLDISNCSKITNDGLFHLFKLSDLGYLNLAGCSVTDEALLNLATHPLKILSLNHCTNITDKGFGYLNFHSLEKLSLQRCNITDQGLKSLPKTIVQLDLSKCSKITDEGIRCLKAPFLKQLRIIYCNITNEGIKSLVKYQLELLDISLNIKTVASSLKIIASISSLKYLIIRDCGNVKRIDCLCLEKLPLLEALFIYTDRGVLEFRGKKQISKVFGFTTKEK